MSADGSSGSSTSLLLYGSSKSADIHNTRFRHNTLLSRAYVSEETWGRMRGGQGMRVSPPRPRNVLVLDRDGTHGSMNETLTIQIGHGSEEHFCYFWELRGWNFTSSMFPLFPLNLVCLPLNSMKSKQEGCSDCHPSLQPMLISLAVSITCVCIKRNFEALRCVDLFSLFLLKPFKPTVPDTLEVVTGPRPTMSRKG